MTLADLNRQHLVKHLRTLGPRAVGEALAEVASGRPLDEVLKRYRQLDPHIVRAFGGDRFPPAPIHVVAR